MICFHIGLIKTGTTYLQNFYFNKIGYNYIGKELLNKKWLYSKKHRLYNEINYLIKNQKGVNKSLIQNSLLSHEEFIGNVWNFNINNNIINEIAKIKNIKIILTIRSQRDIFLSIYKQYLYEGGKLSFLDFYNACKTKKLNIFEYLNYLKIFKNLCKKFGRTKILLVPFEMLNDNNFSDMNKSITK